MLVLALVWLVIGMIATRTRLVGRPGAAAARATWLGATRPWRARESTLGMLTLDHWLLLIVPGALLVGTRAVQTSFLSWTHLVIVLGAWVVFLLVLDRLMRRHRSPWPVIAAVGGVIVLRCSLTLFALSFSGPGGYWYGFWTDPTRRTRLHHAGLRPVPLALRRRRLGAVDPPRTLVARPAPCSRPSAQGSRFPATVVAIIGLEPVLSLWNDQVGLLPWGLARILGLTTYLEIPGDTAWWAAAFGAVAGRRRRAARSALAAQRSGRPREQKARA